MKPEKIKEAFRKVKEDIFSLGKEVGDLREDIGSIKSELKIIKRLVSNFDKKINKTKISPKNLKFNEKEREEDLSNKNRPKKHSKFQNNPISYQNSSKRDKTNPTHPTDNTTHQHKNPTHPRHTKTNTPLEDLYCKNNVRSTRNEGVPTDRQTDRQTDTRHINKPQIEDYNNNKLSETFSYSIGGKDETNPSLYSIDPKKTKEKTSKLILDEERINGGTVHSGDVEEVKKARDILDNLDSLKKELRRKFKKLTNQEMRVFSLIYQLDQEREEVTYSTLASKMDLSEGSIRDYVHKIIKKGISLEKEKKNNKKVTLHVSKDIKDITSLDSLLKLREI